MSNMASAREALKRHFGYGAFRPGQEGVIGALLDGRDALAVMPTGAGKSLCYQIPATVLEGVALVVSPLVSLMGDQVRALVDAGVSAAYLNSTLLPDEQAGVLRRALQGSLQVVYIAPERLDDPRFLDFSRKARISLLAVDEAHCVSQWGQDFRPSYLGIGDFIAQLPRRPAVAALTATATERVREDIVRLLGLRDPYRVVTGFDRANLYFGVERLDAKRKIARIASYALEHASESGIVYCSTRKDVERVQEALVAAGVKATRYHAGLSAAERERNQRSFIVDDEPVMVATNAFGMGIDKSNVRYVLHHNMPASIEAYYQEAGRAGRDGEPAECLLFWNDSDIGTCRYFVERDSGNEELTPEEADAVRATQRRLLEAMCGYCLTTECLRDYILRYFGEEGVARAPEARGSVLKQSWARANRPLERPLGREMSLSTVPRTVDRAELRAEPLASGASGSSLVEGNHPVVFLEEGVRASHESDGSRPDGRPRRCCSNCDGGFETVDVTELARSVLRCVHELRGRFGKGMVADVLRGAKPEKLLEFGLDKAKNYGVTDASKEQVKEVIELLASQGYLEISEGKFPLVGLGPRFREAGDADFRLAVKRIPRQAAKPKGAAARAAASSAEEAAAGSKGAAFASAVGMTYQQFQGSLFMRLREVRKRIADEADVPPYIVFSDAALYDMCAKIPRTDEEFLEVSGVGQTKLARYGEAFMAAIAEYLDGVSKEA